MQSPLIQPIASPFIRPSPFSTRNHYAGIPNLPYTNMNPYYTSKPMSDQNMYTSYPQYQSLPYTPEERSKFIGYPHGNPSGRHLTPADIYNLHSPINYKYPSSRHMIREPKDLIRGPISEESVEKHRDNMIREPKDLIRNPISEVSVKKCRDDRIRELKDLIIYPISEVSVEKPRDIYLKFKDYKDRYPYMENPRLIEKFFPPEQREFLTNLVEAMPIENQPAKNLISGNSPYYRNFIKNDNQEGKSPVTVSIRSPVKTGIISPVKTGIRSPVKTDIRSPVKTGKVQPIIIEEKLPDVIMVETK